jgi:hypothetical protein
MELAVVVFFYLLIDVIGWRSWLNATGTIQREKE